jgi:hypothetical protein
MTRYRDSFTFLFCLPHAVECVFTLQVLFTVTCNNPVNVKVCRMNVRSVQPTGKLYMPTMVSLHDLRTKYVHGIFYWILLSSEMWSHVVSTVFMSSSQGSVSSGFVCKCTYLLNIDTDQIGRAVKGINCLRPLEHWDRGFESHWRYGCMCAFCGCVVLCVGSGLATGWSPVQGFIPTAYRINKLKKPPRFNRGL